MNSPDIFLLGSIFTDTFFFEFVQVQQKKGAVSKKPFHPEVVWDARNDWQLI